MKKLTCEIKLKIRTSKLKNGKKKRLSLTFFGLHLEQCTIPQHHVQLKLIDFGSKCLLIVA